MSFNIDAVVNVCRSGAFFRWAQIVNGTLRAKIQGIDRNKLAGEVVRFVVGLTLSTDL